MTTDNQTTDPRAAVEEFFGRYRRALLDRDADAVAELYAVPALILFPGQAMVVSDRAQTEQFFSGAFGQYAGVTDTTADVRVPASTGHSIWADVTWRHDNGSTERMMYQLVGADDGWRIAVLTPLDPASS